MDIIHGCWNRGSKRRNREYRNSFVKKKNPHQKKRGDGNKGPSKKSEVEAATSWKKNAQKQTAGYVGSHNIWVTKKTIQHKYN